MEEIEANVREAIEGCLSVEIEKDALLMDDKELARIAESRAWELPTINGSHRI